MKTIILMRHSKPQRNTDLPNDQIPLTEEGKELAAELFKQDIFRDVRKVYTSPYKRTCETAGVFLETQTVDPHSTSEVQLTTDCRLIERKLGDETTLDETFWERQYQNLDYKNKDGESFREVNARMTTILEEILHQMNENEKVLVVSHAAAICAYLMNFCEISVVDANEKIRRITFNDKVILDGKVDTPSGFCLNVEGNKLENIKYVNVD